MYNHKRHSKVFKAWLIIVEIVYFIVAIICGFVIKADTKTFNLSLALLIWASNVPLLAILYAVYSILDNQETQIDVSHMILEQLQFSRPKNNKSILDNVVPVSKTIDSNSFWKCPKCGDRNKQTSIQCSCGYFKTKSETPPQEIHFIHNCSKCNKSFNVKYTAPKNQQKIPELSVVCPHCKSTENITSIRQE